MAVGRRLRQAIFEAGYTVSSFAEKWGYSENRIYKWLAGTVPDISDIKLVAERLQTTPGWLLFGEATNPGPRSKRKTIQVLGALLGIGLAVGSAWAENPNVALNMVSEEPNRRIMSNIKYLNYLDIWTDFLSLVSFLHRLIQELRDGPRRHLRPRLALAA